MVVVVVVVMVVRWWWLAMAVMMVLVGATVVKPWLIWCLGSQQRRRETVQEMHGRHCPQHLSRLFATSHAYAW